MIRTLFKVYLSLYLDRTFVKLLKIAQQYTGDVNSIFLNKKIEDTNDLSNRKGIFVVCCIGSLYDFE